MTTRAEQAARSARRAAAEAERIKAAEAVRWRNAHEAASYEEAHADLELMAAQGGLRLHGLELLAADQAVIGLQAQANAAAEVRRSCEWNLRRLGHWEDPPEPEDETPRCTFDGCQGFKALDDDGRCPHHAAVPEPPPARADGQCANVCGRSRKQRSRFCEYCKTGHTVPVCAIEGCGGPSHGNGRCRRHRSRSVVYGSLVKSP